MDSVIENQGFYDYFNYIIVGLVFLMGIGLILVLRGNDPII